MILLIPPVRRSCWADVMCVITGPRRQHGDGEQVISGSRRGAWKENTAWSSCVPDTRGPKPLHTNVFAFELNIAHKDNSFASVHLYGLPAANIEQRGCVGLDRKQPNTETSEVRLTFLLFKDSYYYITENTFISVCLTNQKLSQWL